MRDTTNPSSSGPLGRRLIAVIVAVAIGAVMQFAAVAKISTAARHLDQIKAARIAESHGLTPKVTSADFQWAIQPGALPGTMFERGVLVDMAMGIAELTVVLGVLAFCRKRFVWILVPIMFAALFGYALERTVNNKPCGCFGSLWVPPKGFSLVMDGVFIALGLGLARWFGVRARGIGVIAVISLIALAGGYVYASRSAPPTPTTPASDPNGAKTPTPAVDVPAPVPAKPHTDAPDQASAPLVRSDEPAGERLLASDMFADLRALTMDDAAWYVFIWDPTCPTCEAMLPVIEHYELLYAEEGNPVLQVRNLMKGDIEDQTGIESWQWTLSPTVLIIRGGTIIAEFGGEGAPFPDAVSDRLFVDEPIDDLQQRK